LEQHDIVAEVVHDHQRSLQVRREVHRRTEAIALFVFRWQPQVPLRIDRVVSSANP
jgi:hypothetical protein